MFLEAWFTMKFEKFFYKLSSFLLIKMWAYTLNALPNTLNALPNRGFQL